MSCLLPNGTQRPVLDVKSPFLIYIWNVPDSLQPMEIKKIAQSHKFGRVRFVETFEAWRHEKIGQIIVEFQDGAGLDKFVDALSRQQVLRYDPPLEFMCLDPQLGSAHFFGQVKTWSGVDLLACNAIPPTFHYRTPMPPKVSSNRVNSFFDHGENSEADSTVRGLVEKDEQVPGGGAAAAIEWGGQGHTAAGRGTSFGRGTARASAFVDTIGENTINGHGSDYKTGGHTHDKPPANGGFGRGFGRGRGFAFGHGTLSTSNNHGNDQPSSLAPTFSGSGSLFVAPVFERRERRPLTIQQPPSAVEANDEDNVQEEKCQFSSPKNDNTFCIDVDDDDDLGLPLDANNDRDDNSTTNSSSPELRLETITTVILSGNPSPVSTCSPKEETTDEQTNEDRENFGGQQLEEGMEGAQPDEEEDKKVPFYAQQTEEEARFQVQQKEKLERGQKLMRAVEEKMAEEAQLELMEEQERKAELAQMVEAAKRKAAEEEARKMGEYLADDAGKEEIREAREEEDITGLEDLQGNDEGNDNANGWSPPRWSAHSNATTAVMESKESSKRSLEKEMNPDIPRSVNNLAPKLVEIKKECLEERIVEEKLMAAEEEIWKAHLALLADEEKKKDQAGQKEVKEESQHETMQKPESKGNHTESQNSTSSEQNNDTSSNSDAEDEEDHLARQIEQLFTKPFGERKRVHFIGVPTKDFSLAHVFAAAIVGLVLGNPERTFKLQSLDKKGSLIRVGPGLFDFQDGKSTFTSMQKVNLFTFDMAPSNLADERLSVAGIAYAIYGKRAIAKILSGNDPDKFTRLLADPNTGKSKMAMIFCRIYRRFIQPMDQFFGHKQDEQPPSVTPEFELLRNFLADTIANASTGNLDEEQGLSCFHVAMFASIQFLAKLVQSLA